MHAMQDCQSRTRQILTRRNNTGRDLLFKSSSR